MANNVSGSPLLLDTAVANFAALVALGIDAKLPLYVSKIVWKKPTAAGDTFSLVNAAGQTILTDAAGAAGVSQNYDFAKRPLLLSPAMGWYLSQISSGTLELFV